MVSLAKIGQWVKDRKIILLLSFIVAVGIFLRIYELGTESLWLDEADSLYSAHQGIIQLLKDCAVWHRHPPLHFFMLYLWIPVFGNSEVAVRLPSVIFGIISIVLIYKIGRHLFNEKVGLISSFLSAISYYHIYYSQETRSYSLLLFLTLLSFLFFIKLISSDSTPKKWHLWSYFAANTLLIYTHYFGLFVVMSQIFYFFLFRNRYKEIRRNFLYAQLATGVAFLPWAVILVFYSIPNSWSWARPTWDTIISTLSSYSGYDGGQAFLLLIFLCLFLLGLFSIKRSNGEWSLRKPLQTIKQLGSELSFQRATLLLLIWFLFPIGIPFLISQIPSAVTGIYSIRYTISASSAFYLLVAKGLSTFAARKALYPLLAVILLAITVFSCMGLQYYYSHDVKEQWREVASLVELNSKGNDVIIFCAGYYHRPFDYYYKGNLPELGIGKGVEETQELAAFVDNAAQGKDRSWLILGHGTEEAPITDYLVNRYGNRSIIIEGKFVGIKVYLFDLSPP